MSRNPLGRTALSKFKRSPLRPPPYFMLIDRALRDEGTSYHYMPPSEFNTGSEALLDRLQGAFDL
jgi:hypothetical protein